MHKKIKVEPKDQGKRLDKFLSSCLDQFSRTEISNLISQAKVLVDGAARKPSFCLKTGQVISLDFEKEAVAFKPYDFPVEIIFEDNDIIIVNKPSGLVVHPPQKNYHKTLVNALIYLGKELFENNNLRPGVVHRLDKETSGVMVLTKNKASYQSLVEQFKARQVRKEYLACVWGQLKKDELNIDLPLSRDSKNRLKMKVSFTKAKPAFTKAKVIRRLSGAAYLKLEPLTGRMHQLRVHLKFLGYPIAGDKKYGVKDNCSELLLHAKTLSFTHPQTRKILTFDTPVPERFTRFLREHV